MYSLLSKSWYNEKLRSIRILMNSTNLMSKWIPSSDTIEQTVIRIWCNRIIEKFWNESFYDIFTLVRMVNNVQCEYGQIFMKSFHYRDIKSDSFVRSSSSSNFLSKKKNSLLEDKKKIFSNEKFRSIFFTLKMVASQLRHEVGAYEQLTFYRNWCRAFHYSPVQ